MSDASPKGPFRLHLRIEHVPASGPTRPCAPQTVEWCLRVARSPAVLWRTLEHHLVHGTHWYRTHRLDALEAIQAAVHAGPCACGCGVELIAEVADAADAEPLARATADAIVDCVMGCQLGDCKATYGADAPQVPLRIVTETFPDAQS
ncbi:MAG: hypothetical protein JXA69_08155 [Phycisphaerae bacterium]|nr:hypothetical protein [Phycisphaerae bacterium]